jgi:hypothetical protein
MFFGFLHAAHSSVAMRQGCFLCGKKEGCLGAGRDPRSQVFQLAQPHEMAWDLEGRGTRVQEEMVGFRDFNL